MAQQPNVEITEATAPREKLEPGAANKWRSEKPGVPQKPSDVPTGGKFGSAGPDPGWAIKIVSQADLPNDDPNLKKVIIGLVQARAAALGRAAVHDDIEAALVICGFGESGTPQLVARRQRWLAASPHEQRPGSTAVAETDRALLMAKPEQIRYALRLAEKG
ncbi:MAG: hypothetical protein WBM90_13040 [Acidimicrobiia bacterium]